MIEYAIALVIIFIGWIIIRHALGRILKSTEKFGPEQIYVNVCPICGSLETTTTAEDTALGFNYKCKKCKYVGVMLEMNLEQAKQYEELKDEKK